jgi:hypothetical protein
MIMIMNIVMNVLVRSRRTAGHSLFMNRIVRLLRRSPHSTMRQAWVRAERSKD